MVVPDGFLPTQGYVPGRGLFAGILHGAANATTMETFWYLIVFMTVALTLPNSVQQIGFVRYRGWLSFAINTRYLALTSLLCGLALTGMFADNNPEEFLYFNF